MACDMCFNKLKARRDLWVACFSLKDRNSIINQVYQMVWNAAVFRLINEARRITPDNPQGHKEINGTLHYFIDECFFDSQLLAVRRLTDGYPLDGERGVFSLLSLLNDMKANASLMRRGNLFLVEGNEYDYEAIEHRALAYGLEQMKSGQRVIFTPPELDSHPMKLRHEQIDVLSGVKENQRTPNDCIREEIFDRLIKKIKSATNEIKVYVDKNIAHASTLESRAFYNAEQVSITLGYLWEAHKIICQVVHFINAYILFDGSGGFLATPQYDHLEFIDKSLVSKEGIDALGEVWQEFQKETTQWASWGLKDFQHETV
ncbi:MAG: hypothetical protein HQL12_09150 [Candidatus Omnitrophica bacterium]|nr:hypothetical protein [Candidatus Omnitrophota bacterium]